MSTRAEAFTSTPAAVVSAPQEVSAPFMGLFAAVGNGASKLGAPLGGNGLLFNAGLAEDRVSQDNGGQSPHEQQGGSAVTGQTNLGGPTSEEGARTTRRKRGKAAGVSQKPSPTQKEVQDKSSVNPAGKTATEASRQPSPSQIEIQLGGPRSLQAIWTSPDYYEESWKNATSALKSFEEHTGIKKMFVGKDQFEPGVWGVFLETQEESGGTNADYLLMATHPFSRWLSKGSEFQEVPSSPKQDHSFIPTPGFKEQSKVIDFLKDMFSPESRDSWINWLRGEHQEKPPTGMWLSAGTVEPEVWERIKAANTFSADRTEIQGFRDKALLDILEREAKEQAPSTIISNWKQGKNPHLFVVRDEKTGKEAFLFVNGNKGRFIALEQPPEEGYSGTPEEVLDAERQQEIVARIEHQAEYGPDRPS